MENKGDIRVNNQGTKQIFTGKRWVRLCNKPECLKYARVNGFCRNHYITPSHVFYRNEDIRINDKNIRQKFNGKSWIRLCRVVGCTNRSCVGKTCKKHQSDSESES